MAPQLEASGAEPTLANCVQTALRILAAALAWGAAGDLHTKEFYTQGRRRRRRRRCGTPAPPLQPTLTPPPSGSGHPAWEAGSYLSRFLNLEKGGLRGSSYFRASRQDGLISVLHGPPPQYVPRCPLPNITMAGMPLGMGRSGAHRGQQEDCSLAA